MFALNHAGPTILRSSEGEEAAILAANPGSGAGPGYVAAGGKENVENVGDVCAAGADVAEVLLLVSAT